MGLETLKGRYKLEDRMFFVRTGLFGSLDVDKAEWLDDIEQGQSSLKAFLWWRRALVRGKVGLNSKVKLALYKTFGKFKKYLHGLSDAGTRLLFRSRSCIDTGEGRARKIMILRILLGLMGGLCQEGSLAQVSCILMSVHPHKWVCGRWPWGYGECYYLLERSDLINPQCMGYGTRRVCLSVGLSG